jgi:hypothetical protein
MRRAIAISLLALVVALGTTAVPALADPDHPVGVAVSDPDDNGRGPDRSNGGADKPGGTGGVDQSDQDGNNGCGNDTDREDDNEGWCGNNPKRGGGGGGTSGPTDPTDPGITIN